MSNSTASGGGVGTSDPSSLAYVPYQRRSHARNPSTLSQLSVSSAGAGRAETSMSNTLARPAPSAAPHIVEPAASSSSSSQTSSDASQAVHARTASWTTEKRTEGLQNDAPTAPTRPVGAPSRTTSNRLVARPPPPLVRIGSGAASRTLGAPPPLRSASSLRQQQVATPQASPSTSAKAAGKQPEDASRQRQPSAGSAALNHRQTSVASPTSAIVPVDSALPQRPDPASHARTSTTTTSNDGPKHPSDPRSGHDRSGSRSVAHMEANNGAVSSLRSSPVNSGTATPRLGSSSVHVPAHVHSYAALLAAQNKLGPIPVPQGVAIANAVGQQQEDSGGAVEDTTTALQQHANGRLSAYRPGFQPRGAYRVRTDEFIEARQRRRSEGEMDAQRMERRLAKLIAIHFAPQAIEEAGEKGAGSMMAAPMLDVDLSELRRDPKSVLRKGGSDLWSSLRARGRGEDLAKRAAEQSIVNWQNDDEVKACPICSTTFSLTVRKHHCRLCGRVVCASPHLSRPTWPDGIGPPGNEVNREAASAEQRQQLDKKCSSLIVADPVTGKIEDGRDAKAVTVAAKSGAEANGDPKGVRICRDCKSVIRKRQYMIDDGTVPAYLKLYEALMQVQRDIEESLPEFQEMVLGLQKHDHTAALGSSVKANAELQRDAAQARKQLLANFATYDELAKRIRKLPVPASRSISSSSSSSDAAQERLQQAIWTKANLFLQQNMLPLRSLPKAGSKKAEGGEGMKSKRAAVAKRPDKQGRDGSVSSMASFQTWLGGKARQGGGGGEAMTLAEASRMQADELYERAGEVDEEGSGKEDEVGEVDVAALKEQLGVLLEQERLVAGYVESASRARKFEDARTLKTNHEELCKEIVRMQRRLVVKGVERKAAV